MKPFSLCFLIKEEEDEYQESVMKSGYNLLSMLIYCTIISSIVLIIIDAIYSQTILPFRIAILGVSILFVPIIYVKQLEFLKKFQQILQLFFVGSFISFMLASFVTRIILSTDHSINYVNFNKSELMAAYSFGVWIQFMMTLMIALKLQWFYTPIFYMATNA